MGTWGAGNFDNDGALDYMNEVSDKITQGIEMCLADESCRALDEGGESAIMPNVVMLSLLYEHCCGTLPAVEVVERWKQTYLTVYDESIDGFDPTADYKVERRRVIATTFDRLIEQAREQERAMAAVEPYQHAGPLPMQGPVGFFQSYEDWEKRTGRDVGDEPSEPGNEVADP